MYYDGVFKCLPVEQHVGLCILHHCLMDLCDILVIKLIPLAIDHILTVSYVVSTCSTRKRVRKRTYMNMYTTFADSLKYVNHVEITLSYLILPAVPW